MEDAVARDAELLHEEVYLGLRADRAVEVCSYPACDVDCGYTDSTGRTVDQQRLTLL